ncbi:sensor histidine kinase [Paenibacillus dauci]|uniref:sensor histidine kinase n=1 Tax=Paenibacillus dauci TaxID=1567106 RepID=UPI000619F0BE|nr:HAMP domain-containing sensor histidine kinase [Paenibacillus dauci]
MFKQLRNRFLILNLATISILMLVAFASIYIITYRDVQNDVRMDLMRISDSYLRPFDAGGQQPPRSGQATTGSSGSLAGSPNQNTPPERAVAFMIETDSSGKQVNSKSQVEIDGSVSSSALQEAIAINTDQGQFSLDGSDWAFVRQPLNSGHLYTFMDVTAQQGILTNLIYTFTAVGVVMLILLFFTSRYFANRSIRPVQDAFDKQKQFIADASHELKTPLAVINTNADVLLANPDETIRSQSKWLHYIKGETERMSRLTGDLLYLTEMEDARPTMMHSTFDLSETAENLILTMEAVIFEKELSLEYDITPGLMIEGSSQQMQQVIMILLDNAIKYCNPRGSITLALHRHNQQTVLSVSNTGEGIAPQHLDRIFDRFYRTDASRARSQGGHGLGLAIAKSIVEQHGGRIEAKSTVGESTTFSIYL